MAALKICYSKFQLYPQLTFFLAKGISVSQLLDLLEACSPMLKSTKNIHLQFDGKFAITSCYNLHLSLHSLGA